MKKIPKISYKVYPNTRLKPVWFHGRQQYPIYIVVVYNRTPTYFKSYYFDLLTHPKYAIHSVIGRKEPVIDDILKKEQELLEYLVEKYILDFEIERFKQEYFRLGRDLLFEIEESFQRYMATFFHDEGLPVFASLVSEGGKHTTSENILHDLKVVLKVDSFKKLMENAAFYAPPYVPLCAFIRSRQKTSIPLFSILDWESEGIQKEFRRFIISSYPNYDVELTENYLAKLVTSFC